MKISDLLHELDIHTSLLNRLEHIDVKGIADNSTDVQSGYLFIAIEGYQSDGHDYIADAIKNGAILIIGEKDLEVDAVPYVQVANSRKALGTIARNFYHNPSQTKMMIGITGTNGKTTTSYMLKHILEQNGKTCSIIGTIHNIINGEIVPSDNTTPSVLTLNKLLAQSTDDVAILEVSSHGLTQFRVEGITFDYAIFTNLYHEHLDYHQSMEDYFQAKLLLFNHLKANGQAIINTDNEWGEKLASILHQRGVTTHCIGKSSNNDIQLLDLSIKNSSVFAREADHQTVELLCPMPGIHNMYNSIMAYVTAKLIGISKALIRQEIKSFQGVKGRFETTKVGSSPTIVVDYAHTPDAILHCLSSAKGFGAKGIIHVFGFRGNRDKSKRKEMLEITAKLSDHYILTFDDLNGISEEEMMETLKALNSAYGNQKGMIIPDRTLAIQKAIELGEEEDWVIITGKGHETYQQAYSLETESDDITVQHVLAQSSRQRLANMN
ncbi:UDP-N-acetylmuramoyl-L-alanyl-D-glutamate--2,6-diaminopimelate ligase [Ornithinibacillus contaminans]|uniref:UDP-N-acetylmuramoyl-L-alanyl-D-glutamate--2, 6-diaminopimelate ligase n=1 Tax=Ornithinibacillus contaminans TaxID=694055 RepID=UPI00064D7CA1|nr:UDP-N-acetylmuramoyl-L-alanyl-D-glutamate--2,6-diaminopimelate ligase [Ornithinibacillus contaminans]